MNHPEPPHGSPETPDSEQLAFGGLRFDVAFRNNIGATLRVEGQVFGKWKELLRFDDFVGVPHFHAPADADQIDFDRANGDPLEWYLSQIGDHLAEWLARAGYADVTPGLDLEEITANIGALRDAMVRCVPSGFERVPGVGLQRVG
jgi:hypothetical protein